MSFPLIKKAHRPIQLTIVMLCLLILAAWHALKLVELLISWEVLYTYDPIPGRVYMLASAITWLSLDLTLSLGLLAQKPCARMGAVILIPLSYLWFWIDRILFQQDRQNNLFILFLTSIGLVIVLILLFHQHTHFVLSGRPNDRRLKL